MKIAILDDYLDCARELASFDALHPDHDLTVFTRRIPEPDLAATLAPFDALLIMRERTPFPAGLVRRLPNLRLLVTTGRRNDAIDLAACRAAGVTVCGTDSLGYPTVELALGLLLAAAKGIVAEHEDMRRGGWQSGLSGDLHGSTLGLIGLGRLGGELAGHARALGMKVLAWSQNLTPERAEECRAERVTKAALLEQADYVSIHLRLSDRTRGLLGQADLARMKPGAWLINTSRAPIVDSAALQDALEAGAINAALDVYDVEPLPAADRLRSLPNVILSPHKGYVSRAAFRLFYQDSHRVLLAWLEGNPVNVIEG